MKNKSLLLNKNYLPAWIIYHAAVLVFFVIILIAFPGKVGIDSDLFNLVPKSISMASVKKADDKITLSGNKKHGTKHNEYICYKCNFACDRDVNAVMNLLTLAK